MLLSPRPLSGRRSAVLNELARFRYQLRCFLRFSERAARDAGLTPLQHQVLLGTAGFTGRGWATISELAEFLQKRHNAVVGLVARAARAGLVRKRPGTDDRRVVRVDLTPKGRRLLIILSGLHQRELKRFARESLTLGRSTALRVPRRRSHPA